MGSLYSRTMHNDLSPLLHPMAFGASTPSESSGPGVPGGMGMGGLDFGLQQSREVNRMRELSMMQDYRGRAASLDARQSGKTRASS